MTLNIKMDIFSNKDFYSKLKYDVASSNHQTKQKLNDRRKTQLAKSIMTRNNIMIITNDVRYCPRKHRYRHQDLVSIYPRSRVIAVNVISLISLT